MLYVLGNPQKRDTDVRISPVQFLCDRKLGIRDEKHGTVIKELISDWFLLVRQKILTHGYETNVTRTTTRTMKRDIGGIKMSM